MGKKNDLCRSASGLFVRNLGWKPTPAGGYAQQKFYLGRDETKARLASLRLEQLWEQIAKRWERENAYEIHPTDRPAWDGTSLTIADAIRNGEAVAKVSLPGWLTPFAPESSFVGEWFDRLQDDITVIKIELEHPATQKKTEEFLQKQGQRLVDMGRRMLHKKAGGETLHVALDSYARWVQSSRVGVDKKPTLWCGTQGRQIAFLRQHLPDGPLSALDAQRVEELTEILRLRPKGSRGKPVSPSWAQNCLKEFRRFLRWLNRSAEFAWKWPADLELARIRIPMLADEKAAVIRSSQVQTYSNVELKLLWTYASPFQRLLLLLGLNCGFGRAEVASLDLADVHLGKRHPHEHEVAYRSNDADSWIFRVRGKTGVYGEFKLWPETVQAIEWWLRQRDKMEIIPSVTTLLVNGQGHRYDTPTKGNHPNFQIPNGWSRLTEKIQQKHNEFRSLSFNKLRKTAGNLIRLEAGGEIAAVFLCHGKPVRKDELLDLYTNRPFGKVFDAIDQVAARLRQTWGAVEDPFPETQRRNRSNAEQATIARIARMKQQGFKLALIAEKLGMPEAHVRKLALVAARNASS